MWLKFQSTPPARGATLSLTNFFTPCYNISIHAPREGGDTENLPGTLNIDISIHAPREGGDITSFNEVYRTGISIHAPREGGDSKDAQFYL